MKALELKIPPVVVVLGFAAVMWLGAWLVPAFRYRFAAAVAVALVFAMVGVAVAALGFIAFKRARTTVNPMKPRSSSSLVNSGIYQWTRNPMYLGFLLWLVGWAVYLQNAVAFLFLPFFVFYMNAFQIKPEERALQDRFGREFEAYRAKVRRWL